MVKFYTKAPSLIKVKQKHYFTLEAKKHLLN